MIEMTFEPLALLLVEEKYFKNIQRWKSYKRQWRSAWKTGRQKGGLKAKGEREKEREKGNETVT